MNDILGMPTGADGDRPRGERAAPTPVPASAAVAAVAAAAATLATAAAAEASDAGVPRSGRPSAVQILAMIAIGTVAYLAKAIVLPVIAALILSFLLRPPVRMLKRLRVPDALGALIVLATILGLAGLAAVELSGPAAAWLEKLPQSMTLVKHRLDAWRNPVDRVSAMAQQVDQLTSMPTGDGPMQVAVHDESWSRSLVSNAQETVALSGATVILLFFLLAAGDGFLARIVQSFPRNRSRGGAEVVLGHRPDEDSERLLQETEQQIAGYLWTVTFINAGLGLAVGVALHLLGMPNPVLWGVLCCVLNYVPFIGNIVGIGLVALVSLASFDHVGRIVAPPLAFMALVLFEGNVVTPYVLGRRFSLSPIVIFVWTLACTWMWGIAGAFIAVPMLAFAKVLCERVESFAPLARAIEP